VTPVPKADDARDDGRGSSTWKLEVARDLGRPSLESRAWRGADAGTVGDSCGTTDELANLSNRLCRSRRYSSSFSSPSAFATASSFRRCARFVVTLSTAAVLRGGVAGASTTGLAVSISSGGRRRLEVEAEGAGAGLDGVMGSAVPSREGLDGAERSDRSLPWAFTFRLLCDALGLGLAPMPCGDDGRWPIESTDAEAGLFVAFERDSAGAMYGM